MPSILGCAYRQGRAGLCAGLDRFGHRAGHRRRKISGAGRRSRRAAPGRSRCLLRRRAVVQSVPRPARLHAANPGGQAAGHLHHRRRRAAELGPAGRARSSTSSTCGWARSCPTPRFQYAVRLCPEPVHWGGLSGCTLHRRRLLGQVRQPRGRRPLRRGPLRRHHRLAAAGAGDAGDEGRNRTNNSPVTLPIIQKLV